MNTLTDKNKLVTVVKWLSDMGDYQPLKLESNSNNLFKNKTNDLDNNFPQLSNFKDLIKEVKDFKDLNSLFSEYMVNNFSNYNDDYKFYDGNIQSDLMVIGDKPSEIDLQVGLPFQGEIGKLLDAMLKAIKFDRNNTYYTNLNYRENIANDEKDFFDAFIHKQIELVLPKIIIMFGAEVTKAMTNENLGIFATRGKWFNIKSTSINNKLLAISMFHPRQLIIKPENKKEAWIDLKEIRNKYSH